MGRWAGSPAVAASFLVHGETQAAETLQHLLQSQGFAKVSVPARGDSIEF